MKKRFGKLLLAFGVLLLLSAGALFLFRTSLVAYGLTLFLERQGARQVSVAVERVDIGGIDFEQLDFVLRRGSRLLDLQLKNLTVTFVPAELRQGQVQDIVLEELWLRQSVAAGRTTTEASPPFDLPKLLAQLSADWQKQLPFNSATIADIWLSGPDLPPALTQPLTLTIDRTDAGIKIDCRPVSPTGPADARLVLEKAGGTLSMDAAAAEAGELVATLAGRQLDGSFSLDPARLNALLVLFGANAVQAFDQLDSTRLTGSFTANLNRWPLFDMRTQLAAESLTLAKTTITGLDLEFALEAIDLEHVRRPFQVGRLRVVVDQLSRADFALTGVEVQFALTAGENGNYRLGEASAVKMAAFKSANTSFQDTSFPLSGNLSLTDDYQLQLQLDGNHRWRVAGLKGADISIEEATLQPALTLQLTTAGARLDFSPAFRLDFDRLAIGDVRIPSLALQPSATAQLHIDWAEGLKWRLQHSRWRSNLPLVETAQMQLRPNEVTLSLTELAAEGRGALSLSGKAQTERIAIAAAGKNAYLRNLALNFSLNPKGIEGEGVFFIGPYQQPLAFSVQHELATGRGTVQLTTPSPLRLSEQLPLSRTLAPWEFPGDAVTGRIDLMFTANWAPASKATAVAEIRLEDIGGQWRKTPFSGLSLKHRLQFWPVIASLDRALLSIDLIASGVPITASRATLQLRQAGRTLDAPLTVELKEGHFTLLGSVFSLKPFTYQVGAVENRIRIDTAKLDLAQLTPLFENKGLQVSGLVAAVLPLELGSEGVEMVDGTIRQQGPGVINYRPQDRKMLKRAGMPEIVIKALENFHYDSLEVDVAYQPNGQLDLALRLRGKSPTAGTERPIHLNLNVEQNLLSLLESLRYSDVFDRKIEEYMEKKK